VNSDSSDKSPDQSGSEAPLFLDFDSQESDKAGRNDMQERADKTPS